MTLPSLETLRKRSTSAMAEALRLTHAGKLMEATAVLQAEFRSATHTEVATTPEIIDIVAEPVSAASRQRAEQEASPVSGSFEDRRHVGLAGLIGYRLYRPLDAKPGLPLVVMLHGCTQSPEDFARGTGMNALADELGFLVAYPRQTKAANAQKCWNWFRPGDQQRDRGEPSLIAGLVRDILAAEQVNPERIYVAGISAGGAAAAVMADAYPDIFAAAGIHSGLACGAARDTLSAFNAMRSGGAGAASARRPGARFVPLITFHGDSDRTVNEMNARDIVRVATAAAGEPVTVDLEQGSSGGRRFTRALSRDRSGQVLIEQWTIFGAGHAWSGGDPTGTYADAAGPSASRAMLRFFLQHRNVTA